MKSIFSEKIFINIDFVVGIRMENDLKALVLPTNCVDFRGNLAFTLLY